MEKLIAASESFYDNSKEEEVNVDLFNSFMSHNYLGLCVYYNRALSFITKSWRDHDKKVDHVVRFYFLLSLKLFEAVFEMLFVNYFARREFVNKLIIDAEIEVKKVLLVL